MSEDVAIIGMACMFPGAPDLDTYWQNILAKVDAVTDPPPEAWDPTAYYDPEALSNERIYCKRGGFLGPLAEFNPLDYGIMPAGLDGGEPDQWLTLKVAYDALADAGYLERLHRNPDERRRTAVILGKGNYLNRGNLNMVQHSLVVEQTLRILQTVHPEYSRDDLQWIREELKRRLPPFNAEAAPGLVPNITAGRVANRLDLMGPSYTVDAACASSLVAIEIALQALRSRQCDLALVGGVQVATPIPVLSLFCQLGALSRRQEIRPFDRDADGTILGEGIGLIVLKRRAEAEQDGDHIYAVIKGVGTASDGRARTVLTPRVEGEELALRRAYEMAGVAPETVGLIEAHGTGTPVGDLVEIQALRAVFGERQGRLPRIALGSVKSMIGHTMPAAGMAGIIKAALALYHQVLPPTLHCDEPNPKLELEKTDFYINTETRPWIHGASDVPRRAGVNAFGFGGINAHVVLEEVPEPADEARPGHMRRWDSEVVILAGDSRPQLIEQARSLMAYLDAIPDTALLDVAYTLNAQLGDRPCRLALVAESSADLRAKLASVVSRLEDAQIRQIKDVRGIYFFEQPLYPEGRLAFLFPGEGSQYPNMLADLCLHFPEVRACFDRIDRIFVGHPRGYLPSDFLFPRPGRAGQDVVQHLWEIDGAIEAVLTANAALLALLTRLSLRPDAIAGHSAGEYSAMLAAGIIPVSEEEFVGHHLLKLNRMYQSVIAENEVPRAVMVAVGAGLDRVQPILERVGGHLYVGMDNCPHQSVVIGEKSAMDAVMATLQSQGLIYEVLPFDRAYHTPLFAPYIRLFREFYEQLPLVAPKVRIYSCAAAAPFGQDLAEIRTLATESWIRPVRFRETIEAMYADGIRIFVEVGARGNLTAFVGDILRGRPHLAVPVNIQQRSGITQLNHLLGLLAAQGVPLNLSHLYRRRSPQRLDLDCTGPAATRGKPMGVVKLATGWAGMEISPEVARQLRSRRSQTEGGQGTGAQQRCALTGQPTAAVPSATPQGAMSAPALPPTPQPVRHAAAQDARAQVMRAHLQLMEKFLETQEEVMRRFLAGMTLATQDPSSPMSQMEQAPAPPAPAAAFPSAGLAASPPTWAALQPRAADAAAEKPEGSAVPEQPGPAQKALDVKAVLLRLVSEKTGYPEEVLDLGANLEADLGIDSIKRVEILSAFGRETRLLTPKDMDRVSSLKTLGEIVGFFAQRSAAGHEAGSEGRAGEERGERTADASLRRPPFIREVRIHVPGQELEALCTLSLDEDLFLRDHTLGRAISRLDAGLLALPVVPLTISMEILAEAAACLMPGQTLVGMRHVRAYRWILLEDEAVPLIVVARRKPASNEVEVHLREADGEGAGWATPIIEGTMVFAPSYPAPPPAPPFTLRGERPSRWQSSQLYTRGMFHGPAFQAVVSVDRWGEDGAIATLRALPTDRFLRSHRNPAFVAEPVILDAAGQLIGFWTMEHLETGFVVFPYRLEALDCYGPPLAPWEEATCRARSTLVDGGRVRSDIEIIDRAGCLRMRLMGWEDRRFDLSRRLYDFTLNPGAVRLSEPWRTPLGRSDGGGRYHCRRVEGFAEGFLEAHHGFWEKVLAYLVLNRAERPVWQGMSGPKRRRVEWLLGRIAAKEAVISLVQERWGLALCPADVEIGSDERGRPVVQGTWLSALGEGESSIAVSISHAAGTAVAIAGLIRPSGWISGIGVDIEPVRREDQWFADLAFAPTEQRLLAGLGDGDEEAWALRLWCAKEAVGKALGWGLAGGPQGIAVRRVDPQTGIVWVGLSGEMARLFPEVNGYEIAALTAREGEFVVASVMDGGEGDVRGEDETRDHE